MNAPGDTWDEWTAAALCTASRWLSVSSLVLVAGALGLLAGRAPAGLPALAVLAAVVALGAAQVYLAVRIEFDRAAFERASTRAEGFAGFDEALARLGWTRRGSGTAGARAAGLRALVARSAWLLGAQFALTLAGIWFLR